mmetsp:Transcript_31515/g.53931  ORF Transcript_31515/g.53931 Transcript_31515/m.53931 type:complete len:185 (-) Transcript_31515:158-712(-)
MAEAKLDVALDDLISSEQNAKRGKRQQGKAQPAGVFDRLGKAQKQGSGRSGRSKEGDWMRKTKVTIEDGGTTVVWLHETDVVRITAKDIILNTGGFKTVSTMACMNNALEAYTFRVSSRGGEWSVSDGRLRWMRFVDGMVITGAALEKQGEAGAAAASAGPVAAPQGGKGKGLGKGAGRRYQPY